MAKRADGARWVSVREGAAKVGEGGRGGRGKEERRGEGAGELVRARLVTSGDQAILFDMTELGVVGGVSDSGTRRGCEAERHLGAGHDEPLERAELAMEADLTLPVETGSIRCDLTGLSTSIVRGGDAGGE